MKRQIPIAWCPECRHAVLYSSDPKLKNRIKVRLVRDSDMGEMFLCSRCKCMLTREYTALVGGSLLMIAETI